MSFDVPDVPVLALSAFFVVISSFLLSDYAVPLLNMAFENLGLSLVLNWISERLSLQGNDLEVPGADLDDAAASPTNSKDRTTYRRSKYPGDGQGV